MSSQARDMATGASNRATVVTLESLSDVQRAVLTRVCVLARAALSCERTAILLYSARQSAYVPAATDGPAVPEPSQWIAPTTVGEALSAASTAGGNGLDADGRLCVPLATAAGIFGLQVALGVPLIARAAAIDVARQAADVATAVIESSMRAEELERSNRVRSEVVAFASHEVRDAVQFMMLAQNVLLTSDGLSRMQAELVQKLGRSNERVLELVERLLELARSEMTDIDTAVEEVALGDVVADVAAEAEAQRSPTSPIQLRWRVAPDVQSIAADRLKLRVVLKNLLQNALKFTQVGAVEVSAYAEAAGVAIDVSDSGSGIDAKTRAVMFEPFRRGDGKPSVKGSGLGLYMVHRFLDLMGGQIEVRSRPPQGTTVHVWFPAHPVTPRPRQ